MSNTSQVLAEILFVAPVALATCTASDAIVRPPAPKPETIALFDTARLEAPESIVFDSEDNKYVSLVLTGEIRQIARDGTQSTYAKIPIGAAPMTPCGPFVNGVTGLAFDEHDILYASVASCDPDGRGIWKIRRRDDAPARIAALPMNGLPNGIVVHQGYVYVADSYAAVIWRAPTTEGQAEVWASGAELQRTPDVDGAPGPNGLQLFDDEIYVSNSAKAIVVAYKLMKDGSAGAPRIHAINAPCDDFAFDVRGTMYCGTDPHGTVLRITRDGHVDTLLGADDGLDGPSSLAFGRHLDNQFALYITNGAFPFFPGQSPRRPSLMRVLLDVPGAPRH